jgi:hypothetical protein
MSAEILSRNDNVVEIKIVIQFAGSMIDSEEIIQQELNNAGVIASEQLLSRFDTDGSPIKIGSINFTTKGKEGKNYRTPYGVARVERHVYQPSGGGKTYCPLEDSARIIRTSTPKLAKMVSSKHSREGTNDVRKDFKENHNVSLTNEYIKNTTDYVGAIAQLKEQSWTYSTPELDKPVHSISLGLDGTCMYYIDGDQKGWREAMAGTIALYDREGERLHTTYFAATPEYGKEKFFTRMTTEVTNIKKIYPIAKYLGLADGAHENWKFLEKHSSVHITDFWHATEYLKGAATAIFEDNKERNAWLDTQCHELKHTDGTADLIITFMEEFISVNKIPLDKLEKIQKAITYFKNQKTRMNYPEYKKNNFPIGSGVTEAACKTVIKKRFCQSGMRWKEQGSAAVLSLRCLDLSNRWDQFWSKINQYGISA